MKGSLNCIFYMRVLNMDINLFEKLILGFNKPILIREILMELISSTHRVRGCRLDKVH